MSESVAPVEERQMPTSSALGRIPAACPAGSYGYNLSIVMTIPAKLMLTSCFRITAGFLAVYHPDHGVEFGGGFPRFLVAPVVRAGGAVEGGAGCCCG